MADKTRIQRGLDWLASPHYWRLGMHHLWKYRIATKPIGLATIVAALFAGVCYKTVAEVLVAAGTAILAWQTREATNEAKQARKQGLRPVIVIDRALTPGNFTEALFQLKKIEGATEGYDNAAHLACSLVNVGGTARNVQIRIYGSAGGSFYRGNPEVEAQGLWLIAQGSGYIPFLRSNSKKLINNKLELSVRGIHCFQDTKELPTQTDFLKLLTKGEISRQPALRVEAVEFEFKDVEGTTYFTRIFRHTSCNGKQFDQYIQATESLGERTWPEVLDLAATRQRQVNKEQIQLAAVSGACESDIGFAKTGSNNAQQL